MSMYTSEEIKAILPHRYPFLLIDAVDEVVEGERVVARKNVSNNEPFFQGHFPQQAVMPGVLIVEALAQAAAFAFLGTEENEGKLGYLGGLNKTKFRRMVVPGDVLRLEVEILKMRRNIGVVKGTAYVGDEMACETEMTLIIGE